VEEALECFASAATRTPAEPRRPAPPHRRGGLIGQPLLHTEDFALERITSAAREEMTIVTNGTPEIWMVLAGAATMRIPGASEVDLSRGTTVLVPARCGGGCALLQAGSTLLRVTLPSPLRHMIAGSG
jgi:hypothetical protein